MKKSIFLFFAAILCATSTWAYNVPAGYYVYFEKPSAWSQACLLIGKSDYSEGRKMTKISNTNLYYWKTVKWDGYTEYFFMQDEWGGEGSSPTHRNPYAGSNKTAVFKTEFKNYHLFTTNGSKLNSTSSYSVINKTQTIKVQLKDGSNWVDATVVPADLTASTYALTSATAAGAKSASLAKESTTVSATVNAAYSATVTLACTNVLDGYVFEGWYDANGNKITSYTVSDAHTVYARFIQSAEETNEVSVTYMCGTTSVATAIAEIVGVETEKSFTAPTVVGYQFTNWTIGAGITLKAGTATDATIGVVTKSTSSDYTLIANYEEVIETIYFINTGKWNVVNLHRWNGTATATAWPGEAMPKTGEKIGEYDVHSFTAQQGAFKNVIFTNKNTGNDQTGDLEWTAGKYYINNYNGNSGWYTKAEAEELLVAPIVYEKVYFVNNKNWTKVQIHAWKGTANNGWPGQALTATGEKVEGFDVYSFEAAQGSYTNLLFNNKVGDTGEQSSNYVWTADKYYYMGAADDYAGGTKEEVAALVAPDPLATDVFLAGEMNDWNATANEFKKAAAEATTASVTISLTAKTYMFKIVAGDWLGNKGTMKRDNCAGWTFEKLDGGDETNCKIVADIAGDYTFTWDLTTKKLTVTYPELPTYNVNATVNPAETGSVEGAKEYKQGEQATLTATPAVGYEFVNWTVGETFVTENPYKFTVTADVALVANFAKKVYTVTVTAENGTVKGLAADGKYEHGAEATLTATPAEGYEFVNWTVAGEEVSTENPYKFTVTADVALVANFVVDEPEPVAMTGVVKRALQMGESTVILTHEADGTAHIYNVVEGSAYEVSQEGVIARDPENAGDLLAISDIAVTEDGKLVAINYMICQDSEGSVDAGYKRGETRVYLWNDLAGDPAILFTSKMSSNWYRSKQGLTMAVKGTSDNMEIFTTGIHATKAWARASSYRVINGVYAEPAVNHNDHYFFYDINDAIALETTVGTQYELNASPLGEMNWVLDAELINPTEIVESATNNVEIATSVALTEDLGKKFNGATYVTVGEKHLMVAPYADAEGKLAGVKVLNITAGLASAKVIATGKLDAAIEATAAATAVVAGEEELTVYLVADATVHTLEVALPGTVALSCTGMNKMYMAMRDMLQLEGTSADDESVVVSLYDYAATVGDYQAFIAFGDLELETESLKITRGSDEWTLAATIDADTAIYEFTATTAAPKTETIAPHAATWGGDAMNGYIIDCTTTSGNVQIGLMDGTAYGMGWMLSLSINDELLVEGATIDAPTWEEDNLVLNVTVVSGTLDEYTIQLTATPKPAIEVIANATMALSEDEYEVGTMIVSATWNEHPLTVKLNGWPYYGYGEYAEANLVIEIDPENYDFVDAYSTATLEKKEDVAILTGTFSHWDGNKYALTLTIAEPAAAPVVDTVTVVCTDMVQGEEWGTPVLTGTCDLGDINISLNLEDTDHPESVYGEYGFAEYPMGLFPAVEVTIEGEDSFIMLELMENTVAVYTDGETQDSFVGTFLGSDWKVYVLDMKTPAPENPSALDNVTTTVAPIKMIENGQLMIIKNGVQYNAQGAVVK